MQCTICTSLPVWGRSPPVLAGMTIQFISYQHHRRTGHRNGRLSSCSATVEKDVGCARLLQSNRAFFYSFARKELTTL